MIGSGRLACATACVWLGLTGAASATASVACTGVDDTDTSVLLTLGRVPVLAVVNAIIEADGTVYATNPPAGEDAEVILFGQGYTDQERLWADFTDPNVEEIIITLRLERAYDGKTAAEAGVLRIVGQGAYAVTCETG
ncbi:MAG: hypothetical protein JJ920_15965 [Roseitalea sp.]|jgi:hypothetical protein|nr:hypothetical protein [Roseitalea sp.]MBO6723905.1 hypothetical protein [Roseitalea sp.]MBO6744409.1 hypothetical protein [Roseitalea sp.]